MFLFYLGNNLRYLLVWLNKTNSDIGRIFAAYYENHTPSSGDVYITACRSALNFDKLWPYRKILKQAWTKLSMSFSHISLVGKAYNWRPINNVSGPNFFRFHESIAFYNRKLC